MAPGPARGAERPTPRGDLRRRRLAALRAGLAVTVPLAAVGALLASPHDLAAIRLGGVALGWWAAAAAGGAALVALALGPPPGDRGPFPEPGSRPPAPRRP